MVKLRLSGSSTPSQIISDFTAVPWPVTGPSEHKAASCPNDSPDLYASVLSCHGVKASSCPTWKSVKSFQFCKILSFVELNSSTLMSHWYTGYGTNKAPFLLQNLILQSHKLVILQHNNITLKHTMWHFRWNVQTKTINYYTHVIILPTALKRASLLPGPVFRCRQSHEYVCVQMNLIYTPGVLS